MFTRFSPNIQGIILAIAGFAAFTLADATAKYLTLFYPVIMVVGLEALAAFSLCLLLGKFLGGFKPTLQTRQLKIHILRGLCNMIITLLAILGFSKLPMTLTYTLIFLSPFLTALMAIPVYKDKIHIHGWIAIALGFIGVLVVLRPGTEEFNIWVLIPALAAAFIAAGFIISRALSKDETILSLAFFSVIPSILTVFPISLYLYGLPALEHIWIFLISGASFMAGLIFLALAFQRGKSAIVAPIQYTQLLWGAALGYLIFGDLPDFWTIIGAAIIIASGIYLIETERRLQSGPTTH